METPSAVLDYFFFAESDRECDTPLSRQRYQEILARWAQSVRGKSDLSQHDQDILALLSEITRLNDKIIKIAFSKTTDYKDRIELSNRVREIIVA